MEPLFNEDTIWLENVHCSSKVHVRILRSAFRSWNVYVEDGFITKPVLKPSDGFKAGPTASNPAGFESIPNIYICYAQSSDSDHPRISLREPRI